MTPEQLGRVKAHLERAKELGAKIEALPYDVSKVEFPDLRAELDELTETQPSEEDVEAFLEHGSLKLQWFQRYLNRCKEWMENNNEVKII